MSNKNLTAMFRFREEEFGAKIGNKSPSSPSSISEYGFYYLKIFTKKTSKGSQNCRKIHLRDFQIIGIKEFKLKMSEETYMGNGLDAPKYGRAKRGERYRAIYDGSDVNRYYGKLREDSYRKIKRKSESEEHKKNQEKENERTREKLSKEIFEGKNEESMIEESKERDCGIKDMDKRDGRKEGFRNRQSGGWSETRVSVKEVVGTEEERIKEGDAAAVEMGLATAFLDLLWQALARQQLQRSNHKS
ncbi:hypothetical protein M9H77_12855 [Catharanthus roseus]|uniref:Uncharacterized protein n=1 Tax=Catharanthus roseus TaxID=4058 RepID=A0ACC0BIS2_CATRO|nr:hypothetical protein M9H77_12855 [Catharanthus roseus]